MSDIEALLDGYYGPGSGSSEEHIVIGRDRYITVPDSLKKLGVQYDHNVETLIFDCPRHWDEHDLSTLSVYINYMRSDGKPGSYDATASIRTDDNDDSIFHFEWKVSKDATFAEGGVAFLVCAKATDETGSETVHWNSEINTDTFVSAGMEILKILEEQYPDMINYLLSRMDAVEALPPTVQSEETEEGYRLTLTDIKGVHTVDIKHGSPGPQGPVYELTEEDKNKILAESTNYFSLVRVVTQEEYDALETKEDNVVYIIKDVIHKESFTHRILGYSGGINIVIVCNVNTSLMQRNDVNGAAVGDYLLLRYLNGFGCYNANNIYPASGIIASNNPKTLNITYGVYAPDVTGTGKYMTKLMVCYYAINLESGEWYKDEITYDLASSTMTDIVSGW